MRDEATREHTNDPEKSVRKVLQPGNRFKNSPRLLWREGVLPGLHGCVCAVESIC